MVKIYKYTNKVNGKIYIGQTIQSLEKRAKYNGLGYIHCKHFYSAIQKYGWESFIPEILEEVTEEEADEREMYYIQKYNSIKNGYNIDLGGHIEKHRSEETKKKLSKAGKGLKNSRARNVCVNGVPTNKTIRDYAKEHNMSENTLRNWCSQSKNGYSYL